MYKNKTLNRQTNKSNMTEENNIKEILGEKP